ncbi:hypothetical protein BAE44_0024867, partial [Dichanthelium oligosanthes]
LLVSWKMREDDSEQSKAHRAL